MDALLARAGSPGTLHIFLRITLPLAFCNTVTQAARAVLAVVGPTLAIELGLSASELGLLAAALFAAYALAQLPVGLALDLYGARRVQFVLHVVAACGFALFALGRTLPMLTAARFVLGAGVSAGLIGMMKGNTQWYPRVSVAAVTGIALMIGALGGVAVTLPAHLLLPLIGWRGLFWLLAALALAVALWNLLSVRERPPAPGTPPTPRRSLGAEIAVIRDIYASRLFWCVAPSVCLVTMLNFTYQGLWAGPWLRDVGGMDGDARARTLLLYALGLMVGSFINGQASSRLQARGFHPLVVPYVGAGLIAAIQLMLMLRPTDLWLVSLLWAAFPLCASTGPIGYTVIGQMFPLRQVGRVTTAINAITVAGVFVMQWLIGRILDVFPRTAAGGWDPHGYTVAIGLCVGLQLVAAATGLLIRRRGASARG